MLLYNFYEKSEGKVMNDAMSYSEVRRNLKAVLDKVCDGHEPLLVKRRNGGNVVMVSEQDYRSMEETLYLMSSPKNAARLLEAMDEHRKGRYSKVFSSIEELKNEFGITDKSV